MALSAQSNGQGMFSGINVTPLVDIMLVLLVIFMVTARLIVSQTLPLDLPKAATGGEQQIVFAVALNSAGELSVDSRSVKDDQELLRLARSARANNSELRAVIHADKTVSYGNVVRLMDLLKQGGIAKIAFGIIPTLPEPNGT
jgi:biopolymer transport protein ExbD